jgi:hypothetical protein
MYFICYHKIDRKVCQLKNIAIPEEMLQHESKLGREKGGAVNALNEMGVKYIFANLGGDHPDIIESWAKCGESEKPMPEVVVFAREVLEENVSGINVTYEVWDVISPNALSDRDVEHILDAYADLEQEEAAAGGAFACSVRKPEEVRNALLAGLNAVNEGRSAVINVY